MYLRVRRRLVQVSGLCGAGIGWRDGVPDPSRWHFSVLHVGRCAFFCDSSSRKLEVLTASMKVLWLLKGAIRVISANENPIRINNFRTPYICGLKAWASLLPMQFTGRTSLQHTRVTGSETNWNVVDSCPQMTFALRTRDYNRRRLHWIKYSTILFFLRKLMEQRRDHASSGTPCKVGWHPCMCLVIYSVVSSSKNRGTSRHCTSSQAVFTFHDLSLWYPKNQFTQPQIAANLWRLKKLVVFKATRGLTQDWLQDGMSVSGGIAWASAISWASCASMPRAINSWDGQSALKCSSMNSIVLRISLDSPTRFCRT
jgi:hypothetical protein